jgi:hypothetical protein
MRHDLTLSDSEWDLITELLESGHKQLLVEIRHTDAAAYKETLRLRLTAIEALLERLSVGA